MSKQRIPSYRHHKPSGQAVVTLRGKDHYLGTWKSKASKTEYDRVVQLWLDNGRQLPQERNDRDYTISELAADYWDFAKVYYVKDGSPTGQLPGIRVAIRMIRNRYGKLLVIEFRPRFLEVLQEIMIAEEMTRRYINDNIDRIKRMFKWGVRKEMVPIQVFQALKTVPGLRKGRTQAREIAPVPPIADETVEVTLPHLPKVVAEMVCFQRLTGCRPNETCIIRPCDVDTDGEVWEYRPASHKTEHHGRERVVFIGPKAQDVLRPYLLRENTAYCFSPIDSERKRRLAMHDKRKTPHGYGNRPGTNRKRQPKRTACEHYTTDSYRRAIHRACEKAFPSPEELSENDSREWVKSHRWSPNRLRHTAATEIRKRHSLEAAQVTLGHASADISKFTPRGIIRLHDELRETVARLWQLWRWSAREKPRSSGGRLATIGGLPVSIRMVQKMLRQ